MPNDIPQFPWNEGDELFATALNAAIANTQGTSAVFIGDTPPAASPGTLWWDSAGTGLYIRYNDGSSTQWVVAQNQNTGGSTGAINVRDAPYHAKGDGSTNDAPAFAAALAAAAGGGKIIVPAGQYNLNAPLSQALTGTVTFEGAGSGNTILYFSAVGDGLTFSLPSNENVHVRGFTFIRNFAGATYANNGLVVTTPGSGAALHYGHTSIEDIAFIGSVGFWANQIYVYNCQNVSFDHIIGTLPNATGTSIAGAGISIAGQSASSYMTEAKFNDITFQGGSVSIYVGNWVQGVYVENCSLTGNDYGIWWSGVSGDADLWMCIVNTHCNSGTRGILAYQAEGAQITNTYHLHFGIPSIDGIYAGIECFNMDGGLISNNNIYCTGLTSPSTTEYGIRIIGGNSSVVHGNRISNPKTAGVLLDSGVIDTIITGTLGTAFPAGVPLIQDTTSSSTNQKYGNQLNGVLDASGSGSGAFLPLSGGTVSGPTFINSNLILTPSSIALSGTNTGYQTPIFQQTSLTGSFTDGRSFSQFVTFDNAAATGGAIAANGYSFLLNYGGSAMKGGRIAFNANLVQQAATQNTAVFYQAVNLAATATQPELNGTTPTMTGGSSVFSIGSYATLTPTALGYSALHGYEQDIIVGAQPYSVVGIDVVRLSSTYSTLYQAVEPSLDVAFRVGSNINAPNSNWVQAYAVGSPSSAWPIDPITGTLFKAFPGQGYTGNSPKALAGIDLSYVQFSGSAWHSQGARIDGGGAASFNRLNLGHWSATVGASGLTLDYGTRQIALSAVVAAGGTGYNLNEQFSFATNGRGIVTTVTGGVVSAITILEYPTAVSPPGNPVTTTSLMFANAGQAHGTGLTLTLTWSAGTGLSLNPSGSTTTIAGSINLYASGGNSFIQSVVGGLIIDGVGQITLGWSGATATVCNTPLTVGGGTQNEIRLTPGAPGTPPAITAGWGTDANPVCNLQTTGTTGGFQFLSRVGFNSTLPIAKPTVTGAKGSNAALASLMTALAAYGLVTDSTTA